MRRTVRKCSVKGSLRMEQDEGAMELWRARPSVSEVGGNTSDSGLGILSEGISRINVPAMLHRSSIFFYPAHPIAPYYISFCCKLPSPFVSQPFPLSDQCPSQLQNFAAKASLITMHLS